MFDFMDGGFEENSDYSTTGPYLPDAAECLRCGLCVSHCPTFRLFQIEAETPRARVRTLGKLLEKQDISEQERYHLNNCLQCRACEAICPSKMAYQQLFDEAQLRIAPKLNRLAKLGLHLVEKKRWRKRLIPLLRAYVKSGLQKSLRGSMFLEKIGIKNAEALLGNSVSNSLLTVYQAKNKLRGGVALFTGCLAEHFDQQTLLAAIALLNQIGYEVLVPAQQSCCGAIHLHNGQSATALINNNMRVFNQLEVEAVLYTASGCGAILSEYPDESEAAQKFRQRLSDINDFLLSHWPESLQLRPLQTNIAVHEPCSQRNVLKNQKIVYTLLEKVPGLQIDPLNENTLCCGAGGSYMLTHPENAAKLRERKRLAITAAKAERIVSCNFGCAIYLNADSVRLEHPLLLLAGQLPD